MQRRELNAISGGVQGGAGPVIACSAVKQLRPIAGPSIPRKESAFYVPGRVVSAGLLGNAKTFFSGLLLAVPLCGRAGGIGDSSSLPVTVGELADLITALWPLMCAEMFLAALLAHLVVGLFRAGWAWVVFEKADSDD
jgi:hypothetical protein